MSPTRAKPKPFLTQYKSEEDNLISPDQAHGRPGLMSARDPLGRQVLVKFWPRIEGVSQDDLEQIWRSEIRQLQRLAAVPRAEELFVPMLTSGEDAKPSCYPHSAAHSAKPPSVMDQYTTGGRGS
jgi:hypothetical protein